MAQNSITVIQTPLYLRVLVTNADDLSAFQSFQLGRHSCIGQSLAYAEMRLVLARLIYAFDVRLADATDIWDRGKQKTFIFWGKEPLKVVVERVNM